MSAPAPVPSPSLSSRLILMALAAGLLLAPCFAHAAANGAHGNTEAAATPVGKFVQSIGDRAISILKNKNLADTQRMQDFRQILRDSFDLRTIGRFVIGRSWNLATPGQQKEYMRLFEDLVIKNYGDQLALYAGEGFQVSGARPESEHDFLVKSQIVHPDGSQPTEVDWRVRERDGKFGVIDVVVEGVSLSVTHRQEYASII